MDDDRAARGVTQRRLEAAADPPPVPTQNPAPAPATSTDPPPDPAAALRERQARWAAERARYDAAHRRTQGPTG